MVNKITETSSGPPYTYLTNMKVFSKKSPLDVFANLLENELAYYVYLKKMKGFLCHGINTWLLSLSIYKVRKLRVTS